MDWFDTGWEAVKKADADVEMSPPAGFVECPEFWNIDYMTGVCVVERIIPLCHYCHNFIHSGRLYMAAGVENSEQECVNILEHGFQILKRHGLKCFGGTLAVAEALGRDLLVLRRRNSRSTITLAGVIGS